MNYKTNWYGAIGLASTIGKNSFAAGEAVSGWAKSSCHFIRENIIELKMDLAVVGEVKVFEKLEKASKWSAEKCKEVSVSCQEWETWANKKYEQVKKQEELNKDWAWNVNWEHTVTQVQKSPYWKVHRKVYGLLPKKVYLPSCLFSWRV